MEQKQRHLEIAQDMLDNANSNPNFLNTVANTQAEVPLKGTRFESREDIVRNATARLITIPKDAFQKCFQQWRKRWDLKGIRVLYLQINRCISADQRFDTF
jgi:hypothetical protein